MKTLLISDTHLTHRFDKKKFEYLHDLITSVDQVIINGDFWDHHHTTFKKFLNSKWNNLFPLLKERNTLYVFGNHDNDDEFERSDAFIFCSAVANYFTLPVGKKELYITHGQEVVRYLNKLHVFVDRTPILHKPIGFVLNILVRGTRGAYLKIAYQKMNNQMKEWAKGNLKDNQILICGHSHLQEMDIENQFIDLGGNTNGLRQYAIVEPKSITLFSKSHITARVAL